MLKPSATKIARSNETSALVTQFLARGGVIASAPTAVAAGLRKRRYIRRIPKVKQDPA